MGEINSSKEKDDDNITNGTEKALRKTHYKQIYKRIQDNNHHRYRSS